MFSARLFSRSWYTWTIMLWAALVCYSRIYAGLHYPMDILFGTRTRVAARSGGLPDIPQSDGPPAGKKGWKRIGRLPGNAEKP